MKQIDPNQIKMDMSLYSRAGLRDETVAEYVEAMKRGDEFPPILVYWDGKTQDYLLVDGFHRMAAWRQIQPNGFVPARLKLGNEAAARWAAVGMNQDHGLRRTNADKRRAVELALLHPKGAGMSNVRIAKYTGVNEGTVRNVRRDLEMTSEIPKSITRTGADGRAIDTANIGKSPSQNEGKTCAVCELFHDGLCMFSGGRKESTDKLCEEFLPRRERPRESVPDRSNVQFIDPLKKRVVRPNLHPYQCRDVLTVKVPRKIMLAAVELRQAYGQEWLNDLGVYIVSNQENFN